MRRFEFIQGNQAKYWEIDHYDEIVVTRQGKIGKEAPEKEKSFLHDMEAEVEFDKMIHTKRRQGWVEVDEASEPPAEFEERPLELRPLDGSAPELFTGPAMKYLLWRMVEVQVFERHRTPPDLSRWTYRAWRKLGLDAEPESGSEKYADFVALRRELSTRDRAPKIENHMVGAFKFRVGNYWIVSAKECGFIASEAANRKPKRLKVKPQQLAWLDQWCAFHRRAQDAGGYEIVAD